MLLKTRKCDVSKGANQHKIKRIDAHFLCLFLVLADVVLKANKVGSGFTVEYQ